MAEPAQVALASHNIEKRSSWLYFIINVCLTILTAPYRRTFRLYTWKPLKALRVATGDRKLSISLLRDWKVEKYAELQSVQVAASFCAAATLSTISWNKMPNPHWIAEALWFTSLICSIWAVVTSIQSKSILDDLPDKADFTSAMSEIELKRTLRVILRYKKTPGLGHWVILFVWQFPSMMMSYAWCTYLSGLTLYVCTLFIRGQAWGPRHNVALVFLVVGGIGLITYAFSSIFVYVSEKDYERSLANTRASTNDIEPSIGLSTAEIHETDQRGSLRSSEKPKKRLLI